MAISSPEMMFVPVVRVSSVSHTYKSSQSLTKVDVAETAATDLAADTVLVPHAEVLHAVSDVVQGI